MAVWTGKRHMDLEHRSALSRDQWLDRFGGPDVHGELYVPQWTRDRVLSAFRRFERTNGRRPTAADLARPSGMPKQIGPPRRKLPPQKVVVGLFGSCRAAFEAAGWESAPSAYVRQHKLRCKRCGKRFTSPVSTTRGCSKSCSQWLRRREQGVPERPARAYYAAPS